jgi:hypothetical protein
MEVVQIDGHRVHRQEVAAGPSADLYLRGAGQRPPQP